MSDHILLALLQVGATIGRTVICFGRNDGLHPTG